MKNNMLVQYPYLNIKVGCDIFNCIRSNILNKEKEAMFNKKDSKVLKLCIFIFTKSTLSKLERTMKKTHNRSLKNYPTNQKFNRSHSQRSQIRQVHL